MVTVSHIDLSYIPNVHFTLPLLVETWINRVWIVDGISAQSVERQSFAFYFYAAVFTLYVIVLLYILFCTVFFNLVFQIRVYPSSKRIDKSI